MKIDNEIKWMMGIVAILLTIWVSYTVGATNAIIQTEYVEVEVPVTFTEEIIVENGERILELEAEVAELLRKLEDCRPPVNIKP